MSNTLRLGKSMRYGNGGKNLEKKIQGIFGLEMPVALAEIRITKIKEKFSILVLLLIQQQVFHILPSLSKGSS